MWQQDYYVREKLRELEAQQATHLLSVRAEQSPSVPVVGPLLRRTGRLLRRAGEGLESWGGQECEPLRLERKTR